MQLLPISIFTLIPHLFFDIFKSHFPCSQIFNHLWTGLLLSILAHFDCIYCSPLTNSRSTIRHAPVFISHKKASEESLPWQVSLFPGKPSGLPPSLSCSLFYDEGPHSNSIITNFYFFYSRIN